jgi:hypothetical protein
MASKVHRRTLSDHYRVQSSHKTLHTPTVKEKSMAAAAKGAKAAAAIAAGGGPEDPVGDVIAVKELATPSKKGQSNNDQAAPSKKSNNPAKGLKAPKGANFASKFGAKVANKKLLLGELVLCLVILVWATIVSPSSSGDNVTRMMVKGSALLGVFFVLAILSTAGTGTTKVATALGLLVTASYMLTSSDMQDIFTWVNSFFAKPKTQTGAK